MQSLPVEIGRKIRTLRKELGLTQQQLADRLELEEATVRAIESGRRGLSLDTLLKVASALHIEPGELLGGVKGHRDPIPDEVASLIAELNPAWQRRCLAIVRELHGGIKGRRSRGTR